MVQFFTKIIIFALIMTAPLSFTGDRCPDYRPNCVLSTYIEKAKEVSVARRRNTPRISIPTAEPIVVAQTHNNNDYNGFNPLQQFLKDRTHNRAPPLSA